MKPDSNYPAAQLPIGMPKLPAGWPKSVQVRQIYRGDAPSLNHSPYDNFILALHVANDQAAAL